MHFQDYQRAFTAHLRDPRGTARPAGAPAKRMRVYNELLYNNLESFLLACFPVCRQLLADRTWARLVRAFFRDHACHSPYFRQIPEEFLRFLNAGGPTALKLPDWFQELAHYEWVELALETSNRDADLPGHDPAGDLLTGRPLLNPVARLLHYRWPVHQLGPGHLPGKPPTQPTLILAYRDAALRVQFMEISPATARLWSILAENPGLLGREAIGTLAAEFGVADPDALLGHGAVMLADLRRQGAILGCLRHPL